LHTGRSNAIWAFVLAVATANILYFIYSGFAMTLQRRASRIKNKYNAAESKFILLTGSENGSTLRFANAIHKQLLAQGYKAFIAELNNFEQYPQAEHLIVFTSTHGLGDPPSNAVKFTDQLSKNPQKQNIKTTVVGFGSYAYPDFCAYAKEIDQLLAAQSWTTPFLEMQTVNDKSAQEFVSWVKLWSEKTGIALSTTPSLYNHVPGGLKKMKVLNKTIVSDTDQTFLLTLRPPVTVPFTSGDLLAIYPDNDTKERLYSIAKSKENIQLVVKLHPHGLGSGYLYNAKPGNVIKARIMNNNGFHFPKKPTAVAMISNGTGIAPFLGMIEQNKKQSEIHLYCGFRQTTETIAGYRKFANEMMEKNQLKNFQVAFSREEQHYYVMDLIKQDAEFFADLLTRGGTVMICGSLAMQRDVEAVLTSILLSHGPKEFSVYKNNGQILTDCY
jgi:sulfite reductase (NADPH) flavoprotein alpha-component